MFGPQNAPFPLCEQGRQEPLSPQLASRHPSCKSSADNDEAPLRALRPMRGGRMQTSRREVLALFASRVAFASGLPAALAQEPKKVRVRNAIISSLPFFVLLLGAQQGILKSVGLNSHTSILHR